MHLQERIAEYGELKTAKRASWKAPAFGLLDVPKRILDPHAIVVPTIGQIFCEQDGA